MALAWTSTTRITTTGWWAGTSGRAPAAAGGIATWTPATTKAPATCRSGAITELCTAPAQIQVLGLALIGAGESEFEFKCS